MLGAPLAACGGTTEGVAGGGGSPGSGASNAGGSVATGGSSSTSGGSSATGGDQATGGGTPIELNCTNPVDLGGGFERCEEGHVHRSTPGQCESELPRSEQIGNPDACTVEMGCCITDADCADTPNSYCGYGFGGEIGPSCRTGCLEDADCGSTQVCLCGDGPVGQCVAADCTSDSECSGDALCSTWSTDNGCGAQVTFSCQSPGDQCAGPGDCGTDQECVLIDGIRRCQDQAFSCAAGRPFLVEKESRTSALVVRADWQASDVTPSCLEMSEAQRLLLAEHWERAGQMEHASIAAFARFSLQLLSLGAPAGLIEETNRALVDETRHAKQCFALASLYRGYSVGPGPLAVDGALGEMSWEEVVSTTFWEGCVGETVAALEAAEAAASCRDEGVREVLSGIAQDESRHAELAWKFMTWALEQRPELGALVEKLSVQLESEQAGSKSSEALSEWGVLNEQQSAQVRLTAVRDIVSPCAAQLLRRASSLAPHGTPELDHPVHA